MDSVRRRKPLGARVLLSVLAALALPSAVLGVQWWRAGEKLGRLDREVEAQAAYGRAGEIRRPVLFGDPLPENGWDHYERALEALHEGPKEIFALGWGSPPFPFPPQEAIEGMCRQYQPALDEVWRALRSDHFRGGAPATQPWREVPLCQLLLFRAEGARLGGQDREALRSLGAVLGVLNDWTRASAWTGCGERFQIWAAIEWRSVLSDHGLSAGDLEEACQRLDRLEEDRPTLLDAVQAETLARKRDLLLFYRSDGEENNYSDLARLGWRHLYSIRFLACEMLGHLEADAQALARIEKIPSWERERAVERLEKTIPPDRPRAQKTSSSHVLPKMSFEYQMRALVDTHLLAMRVASAIAWYEAENGRFPAALADLLPRHLGRLPVSPLTGKPFDYSEGQLRSIPWGWPDDTGEVLWTVRRRRGG